MGSQVRLTPRTVDEWRQLRGDALSAAMMTARWCAQPDDLIGGWCVMPVDEPPSCGVPPVADFMSQQAAEYCARLHNASLDFLPLPRPEPARQDEVMEIELSSATKLAIREACRKLSVTPDDLVMGAVIGVSSLIPRNDTVVIPSGDGDDTEVFGDPGREGQAAGS